MGMQKQISETIDAPSRLRNVGVRMHIADDAAGANAGKLVIEFFDAATGAPVGSVMLEDVPDLVMSATRRTRFRVGLRMLLEHALGQAGFTGALDADPDEPADV